MANPELEKARVRLYQKADRQKAVVAVSCVLLVVFSFVAFLNVINSVSLGFRGDQGSVNKHDALPLMWSVKSHRWALAVRLRTAMGTRRPLLAEAFLSVPQTTLDSRTREVGRQ